MAADRFRLAKTIIVTGAAGFIGRNVVAELNLRGYEDLILVDNLGQRDKWRNLLGLRYEDILEPKEFLARLGAGKMKDIEAIFHLGACSETTECDADFLLENNYHYTRTICEWCLEHDTRFIYASSAATYGNGSKGYADREEALRSLRPMNMYGYSKHMFDLWAMKHSLFYGIVGLKYFNVYGPYEDHKGAMRSMVSKSYDQIKEVGKVQLFKSYRPDYADGEQMRDFIYVKDAVAVTLYFLEHPQIAGLFNCGTGKARTWKDLVTAVFRALNLPPQIEFIEMPQLLRGHYQYFTQAPMDKLREAGYTDPFTPLEKAVLEYVTKYLATRDTA